jgi:hypothetical protein
VSCLHTFYQAKDSHTQKRNREKGSRKKQKEGREEERIIERNKKMIQTLNK